MSTLARVAARAFVGGAAGALGRRAGSYRRRRRRVRYPASRAQNVRKTRTYAKKERRRYSTRDVRRLWRAVRALQRVSDPDVTLQDIAPTEWDLVNNHDGNAVGDSRQFEGVMTSNLALGNQYKIKSLNQALTLRLRMVGDASTSIVNSGHSYTRHVRIMYILFKDESIQYPLNTLFEGFPTGNSDVISAGDTIFPQFVKNPGYTFRILYDKTYSVTSGKATQVFVRIPGSVFYDKGTVKFLEGTEMVQMNNYLYRVMIADSITGLQYNGAGSKMNSEFNILVTQQSRWKYFDYGKAIGTSARLAIPQQISAEENEEQPA